MDSSSTRRGRALLRQWRVLALPGTRAPPAPPHWGLIRKAMYYMFSKRCWTIIFWLVGCVGVLKTYFRLVGLVGAMKISFRVTHRQLFGMPKFDELVVWLIRVLIVSAWFTAYEA